MTGHGSLKWLEIQPSVDKQGFKVCQTAVGYMKVAFISSTSQATFLVYNL